LDPGSEWRLHRDWFKNSAMADLLGEDDSIGAKNTLYRCLDTLCEHKADLFSFLKEQWSLLFNASYDVRLYGVTRNSRCGGANSRNFGNGCTNST